MKKLVFLKIVFAIFILSNLAANVLAQNQRLLTLLNENTVTLSAEQQRVLSNIRSLPYTRSAQLVEIGNLAQLQQNGSLSFEVPGLPSQQFTARAEMVDYTDENKYSWAGDIIGLPGAYVGLVAEHGTVAGFIQVAQRYYTLYPLGGKWCILQEHNQSGSEPINCLTNAESHQSQGQQDDDPCEPEYNNCDAIIDILVLGTPEARATFANPWDAVALVGTAFLSVNWAFQNSDIPNKQARYHWENFDFPFADPLLNSNNILTDRNNLIANTNAQALRDAYGADIVVLLADNRYAFSAGIAGQILTESPNAYAIVAVPFLANPRWTFAHEIGHLLGARHSTCDLLNLTGCDDTPVCSHGFIFDDAAGNQQQTIMALFAPDDLNDTRILNYSNPDVDFNGAATGDDDHNNARIIRNHACEVANFRTRQDFNASIYQYATLCETTNTGFVLGMFEASVTTPSTGNTGTGPYSYEWRWSESGIFSESLYLDNEQLLVLGNVLACPGFFLHLRVTSSDGVIINCTSYVYTDLCSDCDLGGKTEDISSDFRISYIADQQQITFQTPDWAIGTRLLCRLFDANGREFTRSPIENASGYGHLAVGNLPSGIYFCTFQNGIRTQTQKIFVTP